MTQLMNLDDSNAGQRLVATWLFVGDQASARCAREVADPDFRAALARIFSTWREAIADKIREDQRAGKEQGTDPRRFAALAVASYSGAMSMAKAGQDASVLRDCLAALDQSS